MYTIRKYKKNNLLFEGNPPKKVLVQVGKSFFELKHIGDINDSDGLKTILEDVSISVKLIREEETED